MDQTKILPHFAISVRQPWAWAIIHGGRRLENRSAAAIRHMPLAGVKTLAIHAAQGMTRGEYSAARDFMRSIGVTCPPPDELIRGAIIGVAGVGGVVSTSDDLWYFGPRAIVLSEPRSIEPIYCSGALGLFSWRAQRQIKALAPRRWMQNASVVGERTEEKSIQQGILL